MLTLEDVRFGRGDFSLTADFELEGAGISAVVGPSGGGKSTLLSLIAGFEWPDAGRILIAGKEMAKRAPGQRPVAILFQDNNLFPHLDVLTNVALGASPRARPSAEVLERARGALERVGLSGLEYRKPSDLSGGQQSRAALARVLLTDRPLVLMDEAFAALGPALRRDMLELVSTLLVQASVLMVTHDPGDAVHVAKKTIFVEGGRVYPPENTRELFNSPHEALARYLA